MKVWLAGCGRELVWGLGVGDRRKGVRGVVVYNVLSLFFHSSVQRVCWTLKNSLSSERFGTCSTLKPSSIRNSDAESSRCLRFEG
jgi:hypothetical protein